MGKSVGDVMGSVLPIAGMAAGAFIPGMAPALGMALGASGGSMLGGLFGGGGGEGSQAAPPGWMAGPGGMGTTPRTAEDMFKTPTSTEGVMNPGGAKNAPVFAPQTPKSGADKAAMINMGLKEVAAMEERQALMKKAEAETMLNQAQGSERMFPYRAPGSAPTAQAQAGSLQGVGGGFSFLSGR